MSLEAIKFYEDSAIAFNKNYSTNTSFLKRYTLWKAVISQYARGCNCCLDLGCGTGIFSLELARFSKLVIAIDGSEKMINIGQKAAKDVSVNNIDFIKGVIPKVLDDIKDKGHIDLVIASSVLEYIDHLDSTLHSINNLLANDGLLIASVPNRSSFYRKLENIGFKYIGFPRYLQVLKNVFTLSEFSTLLKAHGFSLMDFQYYSSPMLYSKVLSPFGKQRTCNLILVIARKTENPVAVDVPLTASLQNNVPPEKEYKALNAHT